MRYLGLVLLLVLAGCGARIETANDQAGAVPGPAFPAPPQDTPTGEWESFPVGRTPRPIVLIGELPAMAGFTTGDAKVAAMSKNYALETDLPTESGPSMISAKQAYEALTRDSKPDRSAPPLPITRVELGVAQFSTDRGRVSLPAWLFHAQHSLGPIAWPADEPAKFWRLGQVPPRTMASGEAKMNGNKLTVVLPAPPEPCPGDAPIHYEPTVTETATVVKIGMRTQGTPGMGNCVRPAILNMAPYDITLPTPLGDRVLLSNEGGIIVVVPA